MSQSSDDPIPGQGDPVATGAKGGGEWPDPSTPPTETAPGSDPARQAAIQEQRAADVDVAEGGEGTAGDLQPESIRKGVYDTEPAGASRAGTASGGEVSTDPTDPTDGEAPGSDAVEGELAAGQAPDGSVAGEGAPAP